MTDHSRAGRLGAFRQHALHSARETTAAARAAALARFERQVDPDEKLLPAERAKRAEYARRAYFGRLAIASAKKRKSRGVQPAAPARSTEVRRVAAPTG